MARSHCPAKRRCRISMSSWLSQGWPSPCPNLDVANTTFDESPRDQDLPRLDARTVHFSNRFWFA